MRTPDRLRRLTVVATSILVATTVLLGCSPAEHPAAVHTQPANPAATAEQMPAVAAAAPTGLAIPSLGLYTEVHEMDAEECPVLDPPTSEQAYWVECRAMPGTDSEGTVFIIGHAITGGGGVFDDLNQIEVGSEIAVTTPNGKLTYRVDRTASYAKYGEAQQAPEMRERVPGRLILVTCSTDPNAPIEQNFVVFATLYASTTDTIE